MATKNIPADSPEKKSLKEQWWHILDTWKVGIIPLPLFILCGVLIAIESAGEGFPAI